MQVVIRPIEEKEVDILRDIAIKTFTHSYEHLNTPANFKWYIDRAFTREKLLAELRNPESFYYFIEVEEDYAGYLKLNIENSQTEKFGPAYLEIERIYLDHNFQGKGIGGIMIDFSMEQAKTMGKTRMWLGVWDQNPGAIQFYKRMGFQIVGDHIFTFGDEDQTDFIMEMNVLRN